MREGAQLGLQERGQNTNLLLAGERLRRAYDSLALHQEAQRAKEQQSNAMNALRAASDDAMSNYHAQTSQNQGQRLSDQEASARLKGDAPVWVPASDDTGPAHWETPNHIIIPKSGASATTPFDKEDYGHMGQRINALKKQLDTLGPMTMNDPDDVRAKRSSYVNEIGQLQRKMDAIKNPPSPAQALAAPTPDPPPLNLVNGRPIPASSTENTVQIGTNAPMSAKDYVSRLNGGQPAPAPASPVVANPDVLDKAKAAIAAGADKAKVNERLVKAGLQPLP